jgi:hypothetical protein
MRRIVLKISGDAAIAEIELREQAEENDIELRGTKLKQGAKAFEAKVNLGSGGVHSLANLGASRLFTVPERTHEIEDPRRKVFPKVGPAWRRRW